MAESTIPRLLWITDRRHCRGRSLSEVCESFLAGAADCGLPVGVLLREKDLPGRDLYDHASRLRAITRAHGATLLISGRADVAHAVDADGVHLPQNDLPAPVARELLAERLLGVSCHSNDEAARAVRGGADYITFGPVFDTPSKRVYGPPVGLEALTAVAAACSVPVLALGGITKDRAAVVQDAGAYGIACISAIAAAPDPADAAAGLVTRLAQRAAV